MISMETSRKFFIMMLDRVMHAPINLYFDVTPIGRIQKKFGADMDSIEGGFYNMASHILNMMFKVFWLCWLIFTTLPKLLLAFIPMAANVYRLAIQVRPAVR